MRARIGQIFGSTDSILQKPQRCFAGHSWYGRTRGKTMARWIDIGITNARLAFVAFAEECEDTVRIISLRKASYEERKEYEKALQDGLESN